MRVILPRLKELIKIFFNKRKLDVSRKYLMFKSFSGPASKSCARTPCTNRLIFCPFCDEILWS